MKDADDRREEPADSLDVFAREWQHIRARRGAPPEADEPPRGLIALALSGGGIRSATFNLGVLQSFARHGLLSHVDYLSTVSGGGYVGGWWSAWLSRAGRTGTFPAAEGVETWRHATCDAHVKQLGDARPPSPDPVHHVRLFSNYLTPRKGLMSRDLWRAVTVISRNLALTWTALLPFVLMAVVLAQAAFFWAHGPLAGSERLHAVIGLPLAFLAWFTTLAIVWLLGQRGSVGIQGLITIVAVAAVVWSLAAAFSTGEGGHYSFEATASLLVLVAAFVKIVWSTRREGTPGRDKFLNWMSRLQGVALVAGIVALVVNVVAAYGGALVTYLFEGSFRDQYAKLTASYAGLATSLLSAAFAAWKGAPAGGSESKAVRAPSRIGALLLRAAPSLTLLVLLLGSAWLTDWLAATLDPALWLPIMRQVTLIGVAAMVAFAITERGATRRWNAWTLDRSALLLIAALVVGLGVAAIGSGAISPPDRVSLLLGIFAMLFVVVVLVGWTTDPNTLSLHMFYKMRLTRAYLGASNQYRTSQDAEDVTETKRDDDVPLAAISDGASGAPYHLINATLNLTTGRDLVIAQRGAAPFLFSREFCGSARTGFRPTSHYRAGTLSLGTAVAISGAAASPVMGSQTPSTAMSMLMALLNVRLGYWVPAPNGEDWQAPQARLWPFYLLREFLSHLADTGTYSYVTDGGHFDNTGVYPLIERGCETIVLNDCGADPQCVFDDLANLVRRCRIDFGAEITFPTLVPFSRETLAKDRQQFVTGNIVYRPMHLKALGWSAAQIAASGCRGTLIVIKPTLIAEIETDINRYSQQHADFPQQSTADQWFDEAQFESYRRLGETSGAAAATAFRNAVVARVAT